MTANPIAKRTFEKTLGNTILLRRAGKSEEIATTALFLTSDDSSYITGTDIVVDGGWFTAAPLPRQRTLPPHARPAEEEGAGPGASSSTFTDDTKGRAGSSGNRPPSPSPSEWVGHNTGASIHPLSARGPASRSTGRRRP
jgi:hypothetical protein